MKKIFVATISIIVAVSFVGMVFAADQAAPSTAKIIKVAPASEKPAPKPEPTPAPKPEPTPPSEPEPSPGPSK